VLGVPENLDEIILNVEPAPLNHPAAGASQFAQLHGENEGGQGAAMFQRVSTPDSSDV
jgi:hypothetical protein